MYMAYISERTQRVADFIMKTENRRKEGKSEGKWK